MGPPPPPFMMPGMKLMAMVRAYITESGVKKEIYCFKQSSEIVK